LVQIEAIGNDSVVSGKIIKLTDEKLNKSGYFLVTKDTHIYSGVYTMNLELKERIFK